MPYSCSKNNQNVSDTKMFLLRKHPDTKMFCMKMWSDTKMLPCSRKELK